jgi:hypothetical protein
MIGTILGWLNPIERIVTEIAKARIAAQNAQTDQARIAAEERAAALERRRDVMVAEAPLTRINAYLRASIGLWVSILIGKVLVWDKALGQWTGGRTDALDPNLWQVVMVVLGFYFLSETVSRVLKR